MTESEFLITLAITQYNNQYNKNLTLDGCDIGSIVVRQGFDLSYEVTTKRTDDYVRLHMHLTFDKMDMIRPYRVEVDGSSGYVDQLGDELFVATGLVDIYYKEENIYKFRPIVLVTEDSYLLMESGDFILTESSDYFIL